MKAEYPRAGGPSINSEMPYDQRPGLPIPVSPIHGGHPVFNIPENGYSPNDDRQVLLSQANFSQGNQQMPGNDVWTHEGLIRVRIPLA